MTTNHYEAEELDDRVVINTILIPLIVSFYSNKIAIAVGLFYMFNYLIFIPLFSKNKDEWHYKIKSALWLFIIIYLPAVSIYFIIK